jgi:hypothetical protein
MIFAWIPCNSYPSVRISNSQKPGMDRVHTKVQDFLVKFGKLLPTIFVSTIRSWSKSAHKFFSTSHNQQTEQNGSIRWGIGFLTVMVMAPKYHRTHHQPTYPHPLQPPPAIKMILQLINLLQIPSKKQHQSRLNLRLDKNGEGIRHHVTIRCWWGWWGEQLRCQNDRREKK